MTTYTTVNIKTIDRYNQENTYFWTVEDGDYVGVNNANGVSMSVNLVGVKLDLISLFDSIMKRSDLEYKVSIVVNSWTVLNTKYRNVHASISSQNHESTLFLAFNNGI